MPRSGGVAILMLPNSKIKVLFGNTDFEAMKDLPAKRVFCEDVCEFLNALGSGIMKSKEARRFSDVVTFGFFCRKANISQLKVQFFEEGRIGRGFSLHIAPSNVPINFAYSLVAGLLAGNPCVVRSSSKNFEQVTLLCNLMNQIANDYSISDYISVVQYDRDNEINDYLSSLADIRVIWGGDNTINEIRKSPLPTRAVELTFADRYSVCVLNAKDVLKIDDWDAVAQNFYNDTYLYDQNACTSPRLMYWLGNDTDIKAAKEKFWNGIHDFIAKKYNIEPVIAVDKLTMDYRVSIENKGVSLNNYSDNLFHCINVQSLDINLSDYTCPGGSYIEYSSETLDDLAKVINKRFQTLSYLGGDPKVYADMVMSKGLPGIDRIVPMGKTSDFTLIWDGYNLIETMSRKIYCV